MAEIKFHCPGCMGSISAGPEWFGKTTGCPHCQRMIEVPGVPPGFPDAVLPSAPATALPVQSPATERRWEEDHFRFHCPHCRCQSRVRGAPLGEGKAACPGCGRLIELAKLADIVPEDPAPYRLPLTALLFSYRGRVSRLHFWTLAVLPLLLLPPALLVVLAPGGEPAPEARGVLLLLWLIPIGLPIIVKRLHDRGKAGHWAWLLLLTILPGLPASEIHPPLGLLGAIAAIVIPVLAVVTLGLFRGQEGMNRFGPPPAHVRYR